MTYQTPKYNVVKESEWVRVMPDITQNNALTDMIESGVEALSNAISHILWDIANEIVLESRLEYAPVRTGLLRSNIRATVPDQNGDTTSTTLISDVPYSWVVHEYHKTKNEYLAEPFMQVVESGLIEERVARAYLERLGLE